MWVPNWMAKVPTPDRPGQIWVADITYIPIEEGWLYLDVEPMPVRAALQVGLSEMISPVH